MGETPVSQGASKTEAAEPPDGVGHEAKGSGTGSGGSPEARGRFGARWARLRVLLLSIAAVAFALLLAYGLREGTVTGLLTSAWSGAVLVTVLTGFTTDTILRLRIGLAGCGVGLVTIWMLGFSRGLLQAEGAQLLYAYLIVGVLLIGASEALTAKAPRPWLIGVVAAAALWITAALIVLGLVFDELVQEGMAFGFALVGGYVWAFATIALVVLFRRAEEYRAVGLMKRTKLSDLSLVAIAGAFVTGYGLWYGLIVEPVEEDPTLDSALSIEPMGSVGEQDRFSFTSTVTNPTSNRIALFASPYEVYQGELIPAATSAPPLTTTPRYEACLKAGLAAQQTLPCQEGGAYLGALNVPSIVEASSPRPLPGPVDAISWNRKWSKDYELIQDGRLWDRGVVLEPGSSTQVKFIVLVESGTDIIKYEQLLIYGLAGRVEPLEATPAPRAPTEPRNFCADDLREYRVVTIDPVASLINSSEPVRLLVGAQPDKMDIAVCRFANDTWSKDLRAEDLGLGHLLTTHELMYPHEPSRRQSAATPIPDASP